MFRMMVSTKRGDPSLTGAHGALHPLRCLEGTGTVEGTEDVTTYLQLYGSALAGRIAGRGGYSLGTSASQPGVLHSFGSAPSLST